MKKKIILKNVTLDNIFCWLLYNKMIVYTCPVILDIIKCNYIFWKLTNVRILFCVKNHIHVIINLEDIKKGGIQMNTISV